MIAYGQDYRSLDLRNYLRAIEESWVLRFILSLIKAIPIDPVYTYNPICLLNAIFTLNQVCHINVNQVSVA